MACISSGTTNVEEVLVFLIGDWVGEPASSRGEAGLSGEVFGTLVSTVGENGREGAVPTGISRQGSSNGNAFKPCTMGGA